MLGLKVAIKHGPKGGQVTIGYTSLDQLDMICQRLSGDKI
jgi:ParB family chromosome partitioning protein